MSDTDDLSTIRGSGLAALLVPENILGRIPARLSEKAANIDIVWTGASAGVGIVDYPGGGDPELAQREIESAIAALRGGDMRDGEASAEQQIAKIAQWLSIMDAVVRIGEDGFGQASAVAEAVCRERQLQAPAFDAVPEFVPGSWRACKLDRIRPASAAIHIGSGRVRVSASVAARREFGRSQRQHFYENELGKLPRGISDFAQSFEDLVKPPPRGLAETLANKIALVYFDGNRFGAHRHAFLQGAKDGPISAARAFSDHVKNGRRRLLGALLEALSRDPDMFCGDEADGQRLRFETLMWGGDEALFVLPAWKLFDALEVVARELAGEHWELASEKPLDLTHAVGVLVCSYKTPISIARNLADEIAGAAKTTLKVGEESYTDRNILSIQVLESMEPPSDLDGFRERVFGTSDHKAFVTDTNQGLAELVDIVRRLKGVGPSGDGDALPRSQLYGLLQSLRDTGAFEKGPAGARQLAALIGIRPALVAREEILEKLKIAALGYAPDHPLVPLLRLAELWDYIDPVRATRLTGEPEEAVA